MPILHHINVTGGDFGVVKNSNQYNIIGNMKITSSIFDGQSQRAISYEGNSFPDMWNSLDINSCIITGSNEYGIYISAYTDATITDSNFKGNYEGDIFIDIENSYSEIVNGSANISDNSFRGYSKHAIRCDGAKKLFVTINTFNGDYRGAVVSARNIQNGAITIDRNVFEGIVSYDEWRYQQASIELASLSGGMIKVRQQSQ